MKGGTPMQNTKQLDTWLTAIAEGSTDALALLYQETSASVYAYALSILQNSHDAEDVLHDCYLSVWTAASSYRSAGKPMAWLLTITKNLALMQLREGKRTAELPDTLPSPAFEPTALTNLSLCAALAALSREEGEIVTLHAVAGLKHREIAAMLSLPLPTVLSKYHRALSKLRKLLKEEG